MKISNAQKNPQLCPSFIKKRGAKLGIFLHIANFYLKILGNYLNTRALSANLYAYIMLIFKYLKTPTLNDHVVVMILQYRYFRN